MDYEDMVPGAFRALMITALGEAAGPGITGDHHFYITYDTAHDGVEMPDRLRAEYPETITIVLQHEFWDLVVEDKGFSVSLAFNGVPHKLVVPFDAVIGFADPSVNFAIQFNAPQGARKAEPAAKQQIDTTDDDLGDDDRGDDDRGDDVSESQRGEVVALDAFRKK